MFLTLRKLARTCKENVSKLVRVKGLYLKTTSAIEVQVSLIPTHLGKGSDNQVIAVSGEERERSRTDE